MTNSSNSTDSYGVGFGYDSTLGEGKCFGYTDNGVFHGKITPLGIVYDQTDADRIWSLIKDKLTQSQPVLQLPLHVVNANGKHFTIDVDNYGNITARGTDNGANTNSHN